MNKKYVEHIKKTVLIQCCSTEEEFQDKVTNGAGNEARQLLSYILYKDFNMPSRKIKEMVMPERDHKNIVYWTNMVTSKLKNKDQFTLYTYRKIRKNITSEEEVKEYNSFKISTEGNIHSIIRMVAKNFPNITIEIL